MVSEFLFMFDGSSIATYLHQGRKSQQVIVEGSCSANGIQNAERETEERFRIKIYLSRTYLQKPVSSK